jgi:hypothetical protein
MTEITAKQRRNAERELTSIVCAGCDGPKPRGVPFCRKCGTVLGQRGLTSSLGPVFFAENYTRALTVLLRPSGQRARQMVK